MRTSGGRAGRQCRVRGGLAACVAQVLGAGRAVAHVHVEPKLPGRPLPLLRLLMAPVRELAISVYFNSKCYYKFHGINE